jgi:hypothetical protein
MTAWEKAGIIAAVLIGALDALIATTRGTHESPTRSSSPT